MSYQKDTAESPVKAPSSDTRATDAPASGAGHDIVQTIAKLQDLRGFRDQHWEGSFQDYLEIVRQNAKVTRSAYQRVYDMIVGQGTRDYFEYKKKIVHYNFFDDKEHGGTEAVFGLDVQL